MAKKPTKKATTKTKKPTTNERLDKLETDIQEVIRWGTGIQQVLLDLRSRVDWTMDKLSYSFTMPDGPQASVSFSEWYTQDQKKAKESQDVSTDSETEKQDEAAAA